MIEGYSEKKSNELINKRKRKRMLRRTLLFLIFLSSVLVTLCLKLPYFNVENIEVKNNKNISKDVIKNSSGIQPGNNIFYLNTRNIKTNIMSNPYILKVVIKRQLPGTIILEVKERDACFYIVQDKKFIILDSNGKVLEARDSIDGMDLIKVDGLKQKTAEPGKDIVTDDTRKLELLMKLSELAKRNLSGIKFTAVDLESVVNINVYFSGMRVKVGTAEELENKLNKAINILNSGDTKKAKGYIDVSFDGNPVLFIEK